MKKKRGNNRRESLMYAKIKKWKHEHKSRHGIVYSLIESPIDSVNKSYIPNPWGLLPF